MTEVVRIAWRIGGIGGVPGHGDWIPSSSDRDAIMHDWAEFLNAVYGSGTHWVERSTQQDTASVEAIVAEAVSNGSYPSTPAGKPAQPEGKS